MSEIAVIPAAEVVEIVETVPVQAKVLADHAVACNQLDHLRRLYRAHVAWHIAVQAHLHHGAEAPPVSKMPGKPAKYRMYDAANWFLRHGGINLPRPNNMAEVGAIIVAAEMRLAGLHNNALDVDENR